MDTVTELKSFALAAGADLVGVAPVERFTGAPAGHHPRDILPEAQSVVSLALRIPNGVLDGPTTTYHQALMVTFRQLDDLAWRVALFIERGGGRAVPVPSDEPYMDWDAEHTNGRGDLSHKHAAQAAGLGRLGKNSLLITPQFGNRVHLVSVVTDVALPPDPLLDWQPCPRGCTLCLKACPANAIPVLDGDGASGPHIDQALCRPVSMQRIPKGYVIEGCGLCRKVCPAGLKKPRRARQ